MDQVEEPQKCIYHSLNSKETRIESFLEDKRESEIDWDHLLVKIDHFSIKIDSICNLLGVQTENDSSEELNKILSS